jgi:NAD(P)-dependent dehydrogenase (short-subunit alcohol dehydrogenase family)
VDKGTLLVVGAGGDVGKGLVAAALRSGRRVVAAGRDPGRLEGLRTLADGAALALVQGDLASETAALRLWEAARLPFGAIADVVVSVNAPNVSRPLLVRDADDLAAVFAGNVLTHFNAVKVFQPRLPAAGLLIGIGGGTADFILPGLAPVSMGQAALRMLYRGLARECRAGAGVRELMIVAMVAGESNRAAARADWLTDLEVGTHVCAILDAPDQFGGPVLHLRSRAQVGLPEDKAAPARSG